MEVTEVTDSDSDSDTYSEIVTKLTGILPFIKPRWDDGSSLGEIPVQNKI